LQDVDALGGGCLELLELLLGDLDVPAFGDLIAFDQLTALHHPLADWTEELLLDPTAADAVDLMK
jgi:hypothetical protein